MSQITKTIERKQYDLVVVGGGMSGVCAALAAARRGIKTALVHNRPVLGGMASSEMRMHICGADHHMGRPNARETGILEEILLENKKRNQEMNYPVFDSVLWGKVKFQENLDLFLNTHMDTVEVSENTVTSVHAVQQTTEKEFCFQARMFVDATGDATLGYFAGAEYRKGREAASEFGESLAPEKEDHATMGNSLMFQANDMGHPVPFKRPEWAYHFTEEQLKNREHHLIQSGYWWIELGGGVKDTISDAEELRDELLKTVFGIWDHIKNGGDHGADQYDLTWVGFLPGKRESRRLIGDYILKESDIDAGRIFEDAVAYGGWPMDLHTVEGFLNEAEVPTVWNKVNDIYTIPYRCLYSVNIRNLFLAGRAISCSHVAFSSTRVMATCAVVGQAVGTAAAMAIRKGISPREVGNYIKDLQQELIRDDCYIPGYRNEDSLDLARSAEVYASQWDEGYEPQCVIDGFGREDKEGHHCWQADLKTRPELVMDFKEEIPIREIRLKFDSNLSREITPSINEEVLARQERHSPSELIREYDLVFEDKEGRRNTIKKESDGQRLQILSFETPMLCQKLHILPRSTFGAKKARIFEIRVYKDCLS